MKQEFERPPGQHHADDATTAEREAWAQTVSPWKIVYAARSYLIARYKYMRGRTGTYPFHYLRWHEEDLFEALTGSRDVVDAARAIGVPMDPRDKPPMARVRPVEAKPTKAKRVRPRDEDGFKEKRLFV